MDALNKTELLNKIAEQGEMIEELQSALKEFVSRRVPIAISESEDYTTVICDDGSIWCRTHGEDCWHRLSDIPQPDHDN